jgi:hypothetical protein
MHLLNVVCRFAGVLTSDEVEVVEDITHYHIDHKSRDFTLLLCGRALSDDWASVTNT